MSDILMLVQQIAQDQQRLRELVNGTEGETVELETRTSLTIAGLVKERLDDIAETYYGPLDEDPTLDPSGNAPTVGDFYYNTGAVNPEQEGLRIFNGVTWQAIFADAASVSYGMSNVALALDELFNRLSDVETAIDDLTASDVAFTPAGTGAVTRTSQEKMREVVSVKDFGAVGGGVANDTASFTKAAAESRVVIVPNVAGGWLVNNDVVNANSMFVFLGGPTQLVGTATASQLRALFISDGQIGGVPFIDSLRSGRIGIVAGSIRQRTADRTKWDYISDSNHTPVGLAGSFATAAGESINVPFDTSYSRVISFVAGPDETFANRLGLSVGSSVGLSNVAINATACFSGAFTLRYDGASWIIANGTGQEINPAVASYTSGTLRLTHGYCRGVSVQLTPFSNGGGIINPYVPILKVVGNDFMDIQWIDTTTGNIVTSASPSTRMTAVAQKMNNAGLFLDGTNGATVINGIDISVGANIWFYGIFEK